MLALVSFYINSLPVSNWNTAPPHPCSFLSKHKDGQRRTSTHTSSGTAATSGGAHPTCGQTFPGEHQRNHQRGFKQPATANTNTHIRTHTPDGRGKRLDQMERRGTKSSTLRVLAALWVDSAGRRGWLSSPLELGPHISVCIASQAGVLQATGGSRAEQPANDFRMTRWSLCDTLLLQWGALCMHVTVAKMVSSVLSKSYLCLFPKLS